MEQNESLVERGRLSHSEVAWLPVLIDADNASVITMKVLLEDLNK